MAYNMDTELSGLLDSVEQVKTEQSRILKALSGARRPNFFPGRDTVERVTRYETKRIEETRPFNKFRDLGSFAHAVRAATIGGGISRQPDLDHWVKGMTPWWTKAAPTGMNEVVLADGGVLVPPEFVNQILMRTYENDLLARTTMFPMTSNKLDIPAVNESSRVNGSRFGGVQAYWDGEADQMTASKPGFGKVSLMPQAAGVIIRATDDLLNDAGVALQQFINLVCTQELEFLIGDAIVNGDGVSKPLGILNSPCLVTVSKETGQAAASIVHENIVKMWARLYAKCRANAVWLINQDAEPALYTMTIGTAGSNLASYLPPGGLSASPYATLMGRPVIPVEFCATLGTVGDILLVDPSAYLTGTIGGIVSAVSMHIYFLTNEQAFRFRIRIDGKPWWQTALTPYKGSNTQSCFVALATRA